MQSTRPVTQSHASDSVSLDSLAGTSRLSCCLFPGISHQGGVPNQALWHWFRSEQWTALYSTVLLYITYDNLNPDNKGNKRAAEGSREERRNL